MKTMYLLTGAAGFLAQLFDSIHVYRDYKLDVKFNISFEDVLKYTAEVKQDLCSEGITLPK